MVTPQRGLCGWKLRKWSTLCWSFNDGGGWRWRCGLLGRAGPPHWPFSGGGVGLTSPTRTAGAALGRRPAKLDGKPIIATLEPPAKLDGKPNIATLEPPAKLDGKPIIATLERRSLARRNKRITKSFHLIQFLATVGGWELLRPFFFRSFHTHLHECVPPRRPIYKKGYSHKESPLATATVALGVPVVAVHCPTRPHHRCSRYPIHRRSRRGHRHRPATRSTHRLRIRHRR